jgi:hypothetical protein
MKQRLGRVVSSPAFGVVVLTPLLLAGAVAASPGRAGIPISGSDVTPLVTVDEAQPVAQGVAVVALAKPPADFRIAAATGFAPPPPAAVAPVEDSEGEDSEGDEVEEEPEEKSEGEVQPDDEPEANQGDQDAFD